MSWMRYWDIVQFEWIQSNTQLTPRLRYLDKDPQYEHVFWINKCQNSYHQILRRNLWYLGRNTSIYDSTINRLLTGTNTKPRLSNLVCIVEFFWWSTLFPGGARVRLWRDSTSRWRQAARCLAVSLMVHSIICYLF